MKKMHKKMKAISTRGLAAFAVMFGSLVVAPSGYSGTITNHSGTICKNYDAPDASQIDYLSSGVWSFKTTATNIICPMTRNTGNSYGAYIYVDFKHSTSATTKCTAYSYSDSGALLRSASASWTGVGFHEFSLNLTGSAYSNAWSDYSVLCTIPGNLVGVIMGVDLSEQ